MKAIGWNDVLSLATGSADEKNVLQHEFVTLVQQAKNLYSKQKKKKGRSSRY
jgi:hypothetical protein